MASTSDIKINSPNVKYSDEYIEVNYDYETTNVRKQDNVLNVST